MEEFLRGRGVGPCSSASMAVRRTFRPAQYCYYYLIISAGTEEVEKIMDIAISLRVRPGL